MMLSEQSNAFFKMISLRNIILSVGSEHRFCELTNNELCKNISDSSGTQKSSMDKSSATNCKAPMTSRCSLMECAAIFCGLDTRFSRIISFCTSGHIFLS